MTIELTPIAWVSNDRKEVKDDHWGEVISTLTLAEELPDSAFDSIDDFSHLQVLFYFHKVKPEKIVSSSRHPRNNQEWPKAGIFAQRGKNRPNQLGLCCVEVIDHNGREVRVKGLDAIDGTPILDIKPVMQEFLPRSEVKQPNWSKELMKNYW